MVPKRRLLAGKTWQVPQSQVDHMWRRPQMHDAQSGALQALVGMHTHRPM
jgi:hypothetical protein